VESTVIRKKNNGISNRPLIMLTPPAENPLIPSRITQMRAQNQGVRELENELSFNTL